MSRAAGLRPRRVRRVVVLDRRQRRPPRQRAQPVAIEIGQDRVEPAPDVAAVKQMLGAQRPHQRVLHEIVGGLGVARQRARIAAQRRYRRLDVLVKRATRHAASRSAVSPGTHTGRCSNNTVVAQHIPRSWCSPTWRAVAVDIRARSAPCLKADRPYAIGGRRPLAAARGGCMAEATGLMRGKRGLIMGVANNRSIAWGIAKACARAGRRARLHLSGRRAEEAGRAAGRRSRRAGRRPLRRDRRRPRIDAVFAALQRALGLARLRGARHRLLRQGPARRPLRRHHGGELHQDAC